eukprot:GHRR01019956.1.p1 GENE.GHRR01019956.1~~GHRR01019956.1.p1  ORF type:complete len:144 (+),score=10.90 GHRR01019956.1:1633-2064(+)
MCVNRLLAECVQGITHTSRYAARQAKAMQTLRIHASHCKQEAVSLALLEGRREQGCMMVHVSAPACSPIGRNLADGIPVVGSRSPSKILQPKFRLSSCFTLRRTCSSSSRILADASDCNSTALKCRAGCPSGTAQYRNAHNSR